MLKSNLTNKAYQRIIFFFLFEIFPIYQVFYLLAFLIRPIRSTTRIVRCRATLVTWHKKPCKVFLAWQKGKEPHERKSSIYELHFNLVRTNRSLHRERCFSSCHERGANKKNILSPHEESNLKPTDSAPRCFGILLNGTRRSEVRFLIGTQNFFFAPRS